MLINKNLREIITIVTEDPTGHLQDIEFRLEGKKIRLTIKQVKHIDYLLRLIDDTLEKGKI